MASGPSMSWQIDMETVTDFILGGSKITADGECSHEIERCLLLGRKFMTKLDSILKSGHYFANKDPSSQSYGFSSSHVWMRELDYKESWELNNWCYWTVVLERPLRVLWTVRSSNSPPKGNQSSIFIGRTDVEAETPILWPPDAKNWLIGKEPDAGWDWSEGREGDKRRWGGRMASLIWWMWVWVSTRSWWWTEKPGMLQSMEVSKTQTWLSDWTELNHSNGTKWRATKEPLDEGERGEWKSWLEIHHSEI